jgi:hypothetical protein
MGGHCAIVDSYQALCHASLAPLKKPTAVYCRLALRTEYYLSGERCACVPGGSTTNTGAALCTTCAADFAILFQASIALRVMKTGGPVFVQGDGSRCTGSCAA